jgi:GDPmannose 4,6-dehydratase
MIDFRSILQTSSANQHDEVYNSAGRSSVEPSFEQPAETIENISIGTLNLLEAVRLINRPIPVPE